MNHGYIKSQQCQAKTTMWKKEQRQSKWPKICFSSESILKEPIRVMLTKNEHNYPLTYEKMCLLLDITQGEKEPNAVDIMTQFTNNVSVRRTMLSDIREKLLIEG